MFIIYLDASGRPEQSDPESFTLASVIIKEQNYQDLDNKIKQIKLKHFPSLPDEKVEFHAKDMMNREEFSNHFLGIKFLRYWMIFLILWQTMRLKLR